MRDDKDFVVDKVGRLIASHREPGSPPSFNDFTLATYLYSNGIGYVEGRLSPVGGQALRHAAAILTAHPEAALEPLLGQMAAVATERGDDEQSHALTSAVEAWAAERPAGDPATWLITRSVYVETGGDGD